MESAGTMKMATGEGSPSGKVLEQGPDWFLVAIDLGYFLEVWGYIRGVGVGNKSGGPRGVHEVGGAPRGVGAPPPLWWPRDSSSPSPMLCGLLLVQKQSP